jgi:hypothetical protein
MSQHLSLLIHPPPKNVPLFSSNPRPSQSIYLFVVSTGLIYVVSTSIKKGFMRLVWSLRLETEIENEVVDMLWCEVEVL